MGAAFTVADPRQTDADPNPAFPGDAVLDPDPIFYFNVDPDPTLTFMWISNPLFIRIRIFVIVMRICNTGLQTLHGSLVTSSVRFPLMRIRIRLLTLMQIRIRRPKMLKIHKAIRIRNIICFFSVPFLAANDLKYF